MERLRSGVLLWSEEDVMYLRCHYAWDAACDIADVLGISVPSVVKKARELCLLKSKAFNRRDYTGRYVKNYVHSRSNEK